MEYRLTGVTNANYYDTCFRALEFFEDIQLLHHRCSNIVGNWDLPSCRFQTLADYNIFQTNGPD